MKKLNLKRAIVLYPFLFAIFPILALYAYNSGELSLSSIWMPIALSFGLALLLFILSWLFFRHAMKAGIVTSAFLVIFFADGHVNRIMQGWGFPRIASYMPVAWGIVFVGIFYLVARTKRKLNNLTTILNVVGVTLILISSVNIAVHEFKRPSYYNQSNTTFESELGGVSTLPDIYYIILDGYPGAATLKELYGYDNSGFLNYLSGKGFYIGNESMSNYCKTELSLASSLNMDYINYLTDIVGEQSKDMNILVEMIKNNRVMNQLRELGYTSVHIESLFERLKYNEYADLNVGFDQPKSKLLGLSVTDPFQDLLVETTMLNRFRSLSIMQETSYYRASVLNSLNKLAEMPDEKWPRPKFVFAHISCPHWPYVFGANGEVIEVLPWYQSDPLVMEKHLNQVKFLNGKVASIVEEILAKSQSPPIIILQGDHGSRYHCSNQYTNAQCMLDDFDILNAYYFPNGSDGLLYKTISPVNSFRVVFDTYFGGNYTLLDDRSFHSDILNSPYKFTDVTTTLMNH